MKRKEQLKLVQERFDELRKLDMSRQKVSVLGKNIRDAESPLAGLGRSNQDLDGLLEKRAAVAHDMKILKDTIEWAETGDYKELGKVQTSRLHESLDDRYRFNPKAIDEIRAKLAHAQIFLVQHDWSAAIAGTEAEEGEFRYPADLCVFEFLLGGRHHIRFVDADQSFDIWWTPHGWGSVELRPEDKRNIDYIVNRQIRAFCILLEAEALEVEVIRAPHKLNRAREKRGKLPIQDHHVVKLASRRRYSVPSLPGAPVEDEQRRSPRLHFRRGHWRHFPDHKTWIKWQLVGDASLGVIDKTYLA